MSWNWINFFTLGILVILMLPNIVYAKKFKGVENKCKNRFANISEQVGRYGTMIFMVFSVGIEFGFSSENKFAVWLVLSAILLVGYWVCWVLYFKKQSMTVALLLAILPSILFLECGVFLRYWVLTAFAVVFTASHIYVSYINAKE